MSRIKPAATTVVIKSTEEADTVLARKGRNPRTGEILEIPAGKKLVFITCKELKEAMRS